MLLQKKPFVVEVRPSRRLEKTKPSIWAGTELDRSDAAHEQQKRRERKADAEKDRK